MRSIEAGDEHAKELDKSMTYWQRMHVFHTWDKWVEIENGDRKRFSALDFKTEIKIGSYVTLEKKCLVCGFRKFKDIRF